MRVLFIEDEKNKANQIAGFLKENVMDLTIIERNSYTSGIIELRNNKFDFVLLDMSLPLYDVSENDFNSQYDFETFAGIDILDEMNRLRIEYPVIVVTAFDILGDSDSQVSLEQLDAKMKDEYSQIYLGAIHFNMASLEWRNKLLDYLK